MNNEVSPTKSEQIPILHSTSIESLNISKEQSTEQKSAPSIGVLVLPKKEEDPLSQSLSFTRPESREIKYLSQEEIPHSTSITNITEHQQQILKASNSTSTSPELNKGKLSQSSTSNSNVNAIFNGTIINSPQSLNNNINSSEQTFLTFMEEHVSEKELLPVTPEDDAFSSQLDALLLEKKLQQLEQSQQSNESNSIIQPRADSESQENKVRPKQNSNSIPLPQKFIDPKRSNKGQPQIPDGNQGKIQKQGLKSHQNVAPPAAPANREDPEFAVEEIVRPNPPQQAQRAGARPAKDLEVARRAREAGLARQAAVQARRAHARNNNIPLEGAENFDIIPENIQQIKAQAQNDVVNTTQQALETACVKLRNLGPDHAKVKIKSKLETDQDGSYILETYRCGDKDYYKINCSYTLTLTDAEGKEIKDAQGNPVQVTIKKYIFLKTPSEPQNALLAFSKYKDLITQLVTQNTNGRLTGDYNAANRSDLLNQHDFTFTVNTDQNTGLKSLNQISAQIPNNGANPARTLNINLAPKQLGEGIGYLRDFHDLRGSKAKKAQITPQAGKFVSGKRVYKSKEHALQDAAYKIRDPQAYQRLIQEKSPTEFNFKLYLLSNEREKAEEKLDKLQAAFKESQFLGLGSRNTEKYGEFLDEIASQSDTDKFKKAKPKEETEYLKLAQERKALTHDVTTLNTRIQDLQNVQNQAANFANLKPADQNLVSNKKLSIEEQLKELKAINPAWQARIDTLLTSNRPAAYYLQDPANADIVQELSSKSQTLKINATVKSLIEKRDEKTEALEQLKQTEIAFQGKLDAFNKHLIELENAHKEFLELTHRLRNLREQAEREPNPLEPNHHKILEEITEKQLTALEKKAAESEKFIKQIRKDLDNAGVKLTPKDALAAANALNIADQGLQP